MFKLLKVGYCFHPEAMVAQGASWKATVFPSMVALIKHPTKGYILFDTGYANRFNDATQSFPERLYRWLTPMTLPSEENLLTQLQTMGIALDEINYVFISHFHADHIAGLIDFPNAHFVCSREGLQSFYQRKGVRGLIKGYLPALLPDDFENRVSFIEDKIAIPLAKPLLPFSCGYDLFNDGACIAIELPGHAYGHFGLLFHNNDLVNFLIGDACWTEDAYKLGVKPNPLTKLIMSDAEQYHMTLDKLASLYGQNQSIRLIPSHCKHAFEGMNHD